MNLARRGVKERLPLGDVWVPWAVAALCLAPFAELVGGDRVLPTFPWSDYTTFQLPVHQFVRSELRAGRLPLWIGLLGNGMPLHAAGQSGIFYPGLTLPLLILPANAALKLCILVHLALAFAGQYAAARVLGARHTGASLAAAGLTQSGFLVNHLMAGHVSIVIGVSLIPWFLWAIVRLLRRPGCVRAVVVAIIGAALVLGSHTQIAYYAALLAVAWTLGSIAGTEGWYPRRRQLAWAAVAAALAVAVSAVQWVSTLELVRDGLPESPRGDAGFASSYAMTTLDLVRLIVPDVAGNPVLGKPAANTNSQRKQGNAADTNPQRTQGNANNHAYLFHERVVYLGLLCPLAAVYGLTRARVDRWQWGAAALAAVGMLSALGNVTPWFDGIGQIVPGWYWFRCAGRIFAVITPLVGLLAARGLDAWLAREPAAWRGRPWLLPAALGFAANLTLLPQTLLWEPTPAAAVARAWSRAPEEFLTAAAFLGATAASLALAALFGKKAPRAAALAVLAVALADLRCHNAANFRLADDAPAFLPAELLSIEPPIRFAEAPSYPRVRPFELSYSAMVRPAIECGRSMVGTNEGGVLPAALSRYFRAVERDPALAFALAGCAYRCDRGGEHWQVVPDALARARLATGRAADLCGVDIEQLTRDDLARLRAGSRPVRITNEAARRLRIDVEAPTDGMLVLADNFYPGWNCTVDGQESAIEAAHGVFCAVRLRAGPHQVEMRYEPRSFVLGAALSATGIALVVLLAVAGSHRAQAGRLTDAALVMGDGP